MSLISLPTETTLLGIFLATVSAITYALEYLCIRIGTENKDINNAVFIVLLCNVALIGPVAAVQSYPDYTLSVQSVGAFGAAGLAGLLLARVFTYASTRRIGASRASPIVASSTLLSVLFAVIFLGEIVSMPQTFGIFGIVVGLTIISWESSAKQQSEIGSVWLALALAMLAAVFLAVQPVFMKIGGNAGTDLLVDLSIMPGAAFVGYLGYLSLDGSLLELRIVEAADATWLIAAGVCSTISLVTYFVSLQLAPVSVVVPIVQAAPLVVVTLSFFFLPSRLERVTYRLGIGAITVVCGVILVSLTG